MVGATTLLKAFGLSITVDESTHKVFHGFDGLAESKFRILMKTLFLAGLLTWANLLCGCDKQAKINSQKIDALSERMTHQEQIQSKQMALLQAQMAMLAPQLDKETSAYFEKNHDYALFFHTNTLFLLITIGKQIEAQLQAAEVARNEQNSRAYNYHTNQVSTAYLCAAQIEEELTSLAKKLEEQINTETRQTATGLSNALVNQITAATTPTPADLDWRKQMQLQSVQIQHTLESMSAKLSTPNILPPVAPATLEASSSNSPPAK